MPSEKQLANLSRSGPGRTARPRVYVGCLPCAQGLYVADVEHANRWIETHWRRCKRPFVSPRQTATEALNGTCRPETPREPSGGHGALL